MVVIAIVGILAAIAIPSFIKARETAQLNGCIHNMKTIETAKETTAAAHQYRAGADIPSAELSQSLKRDLKSLACPGGGSYTVNPVGQDPACSIHGRLSEAGNKRITPGQTPGDIEPEAGPQAER